MFIPHHTARSEHPSGDVFTKIAAIGPYDGEYGSGDFVRKVKTGREGRRASFGDIESGEALSFLKISTLDLFLPNNLLRGKEIATAVPAVTNPNRLAWRSEGAGLEAITFRLHDPFSVDRSGLFLFIAGLVSSIGAAALLLLLERVLSAMYRLGKSDT